MSSAPSQTALFVFGTRPEAIKMAPVIRAFQKDTRFRTHVCVTGQHRAMLDQVLEFFALQPDDDLNLMTTNQSLTGLSAKALVGCADIYAKVQPDVVFVQGDTTTAFVAAFAAFLAKIPVAHIEAGLRSGARYSPFPEEINRVLLSDVATMHFAPLETARQNLAREGITEHVFVVGNTVVDALLLGLGIIRERGEETISRNFPDLNPTRPLVLVTIHRRENFGAPLEGICDALRCIAERHPEAQILYPVHLNPNVRDVVFRRLDDLPNLRLIEPVSYAEIIWLMSKAALIVTDSGGIQEEAPSLGVPVLVVREVTERGEGVAAGCAQLVGVCPEQIVSAAGVILNSGTRLPSCANPYGDGRSSERILEATWNVLQAARR